MRQPAGGLHDTASAGTSSALSASETEQVRHSSAAEIVVAETGGAEGSGADVQQHDKDCEPEQGVSD